MGREELLDQKTHVALPKSSIDLPNRPAENVGYYTPKQVPIAGTAVSENAPKLFTPLKIRDMTMHNRIMVVDISDIPDVVLKPNQLAPICQYSADDRHFTSWSALLSPFSSLPAKKPS